MLGGGHIISKRELKQCIHTYTYITGLSYYSTFTRYLKR